MMRKISYILLLAVCLCHNAAQAAKAEQPSSIDSLVQSFDRQPSVATANKFLALLHEDGLVDEPITMTAQTHPDTLRQQMWYWAAEHYYDQQRFAEAESYALKALPLCRVGNDRIIEGDCLSLLSLIYVRQGDFDKAAKYAKLTNELDRKSGDAGNIASSYNTLAGIYMSARQPQEAAKYIKQALVYAEKAGNQQRMAVVLGMASEVYMKLGDAKESLSFATRAHKLECSLGRKDKAAIRQAQRASALISLGRHDEAKTALLDAIPHLRQGANRHSLGIACNQMGILLHAEGNDSAAVRYFDEALAIFTEQHDLYNESQSHKGLYDALRRTDPTTAMLHNDRYNELRDSIYDSETGQLLSQYAAEYDYDTLQASLVQQRQNLRRTLLYGGGVVLLLALLALGIYRVNIRRQRKRTAELMEKIDRVSRQYEMMRLGRSLESTPVPSYGEAIGESANQNSPSLEVGEGETVTDALDEQDREFILRLVEAVDAAISRRDTSVDSIASALNMSTATLRRRIIEATGDNPKAVILAIQLQKACILLSHHADLSVADVALRSGFEEAANFTRAFKRTFGITPTQFANGERQRERQRVGEQSSGMGEQISGTSVPTPQASNE